ncbi:hypothetical protein AVEN_91921-1 [Araneus ventricosus]|nr:hypothetical protein AVEN_91921-1 [Araneus ventricosus]
MILATVGELDDAWRVFLPLRVAFCRHAPDGFRTWQKEMMPSVRHENSTRQVVSLTAVAIETGSPRRNPFQVGRSSLKFVTLARLAPIRKERATSAKPRRRRINYCSYRHKLAPRTK